MKKKISIGIILFVVGYIFLYVMNDLYYEDNHIPIISIDLKDVSLDQINNGDKEDKYFDNSIIIYENGKKTFSSTVMIKGRGNFTWNLDKKPYQITFDEKTSILGLPKGKKFILLANATDNSLMKNDFSYSVAKSMKLNYSFTGVFVDLYVDHKYIGNYYVTPKIAISPTVVDLKNKNAILMELDNTYFDKENPEDVFVSDIYFDHLVLKDSDSDTIYDDINVFQEKYNQMERAIQERDYSDLSMLIDVDSFAKFYIISEFSENSDALRSSLFFYMDGYDDKIHIGPIWDCDIGYGLKPAYSNVEAMPIRDYQFPDEEGISVLFTELLKMGEFQNTVKDIWSSEGKDVYLKEISNLDEKIEKMNESGASNNRYWKKLNYKSVTSTLVDWINRRYISFNREMEK